MAVIRLPDRVFAGDYGDVVTPVSGDTGKALMWNHTNQRAEWVSAATVPGGSTTQVQRNLAGAFSGDSGFTYNGAGMATLSTALISPVWRPASNSTASPQIQDASGNAILTVDSTNRAISIRKLSVSLTAANQNDTLDHFVVQSAGDSNWRGARYIWTDSDGASNSFGFRIEAYNVGGGASNRILRMNFLNLTGLNLTGLSDYVWQFGSIFQANAGMAGTYHSDLPIILRQHTNGGANKAIKFYTQDTANLRVAIWETGYVSFGGNHEAGAWIDIGSSIAASAAVRIRPGVAVSSPNDGDIWYPSAGRLTFRRNTTSEIFATGAQATGGSATAGASWTATEQTMLQKCYDICRTFGLLS